LMFLEIYHEKQQEALCAVHCLNNLLQQQYMTVSDLATIANTLDSKEEEMYRRNGVNSEEYLKYLERGATNSSNSGDFSVSVIVEALKVVNLELKWIGKNEFIDLNTTQAFIANFQHHWIPIRRFSSLGWYNLDSTKEEPEPISTTYLELFLRQLQVEGYSIFQVIGNLPPCQAEQIKIPQLTEDETLRMAINESLKDQENSFSPMPLPKTQKEQLNFDTDFERYILFSGRSESGGVKIQFRLPNGIKEVLRLDPSTPLSILYGISYHKFKVSSLSKLLNLSTSEIIPNDKSKTIGNANLNNVTIAILI